MTSGQVFYCTNEKGKCKKNFLLQKPVITILVNTSTSNHEKHWKVRQQWRQKRKKACVRIQRVKTDSSFYPTDIHVKDEIIRRYPSPLAPITNKLICFMKMSQRMEILRKN